MSIAHEIQTAIAGKGAPLSFAEFMQVALYHPGSGYYTRAKERVGFGGTTDFYTASATGEVFGELVTAAAVHLLAPEDPATFAFVEIGAEPAGRVLGGKNVFGGEVTIRHGDPIKIPKRAVVFSNELFDAQPFHRLVRRNGVWRELGVDWDDGPIEVFLPRFSPAVEKAADLLPKEGAEGYHLDLPLAAVDLLKKIATASKWRGALLVFDYGKSWRELTEGTPQGTARAYRRHRQSNDLLANPGEQDLTCHICWDWLTAVLDRSGFENVSLQSQEAFFITHAASAIEKIITAKPGQLDPRRQTLQHLLHPGHMGQKFQVLSAHR